MTVALYWISGIALAYSLAGYGLILLAVARAVPPRPVRHDAAPPRRISILVAAYNEAPVIADKMRNTAALDPGGAEVEVIVVDDGSDDGTAAAARAAGGPGVAVLEPGRLGKAGALAEGLARCTGDIVVFSDANAMLAPGTLVAMLRHYADPSIGGVCGQITVDGGDAGGIGRSEGLFWRYDQALKMAEARVGGTVSAQGSVYSVRRSLARPPRPGCTDDFDISVAVVHAGRRLAFEPGATTTEVTTEDVGSEMRRRIRSSERGWRSLMANAALMNPWRHGLYAWQLISHKLVRRLNPLFLVILFGANVALLDDGWFYAVTGALQVAFYAAALAGLAVPGLRRFRAIALPGFFVFAHAAMAIGVLRSMAGRRSTLWTPARKAT